MIGDVLEFLLWGLGLLLVWLVVVAASLGFAGYNLNMRRWRHQRARRSRWTAQ